MSLTADPTAIESEPIAAAAPLTTSRSTHQPTTTTRFWATLSLSPATLQTLDLNQAPRAGRPRERHPNTSRR